VGDVVAEAPHQPKKEKHNGQHFHDCAAFKITEDKNGSLLRGPDPSRVCRCHIRVFGTPLFLTPKAG
jgi:hypothetical protein